MNLYQRIFRFVRIGVRSELTPAQTRLVQLTNVVTMSIVMACVIGMLLYAYLWVFEPTESLPLSQILLPSIELAMCLGVFYLNSRQHYWYAKVLLLLSGALTITAMGFLFQQSGGDSLYFLIVPMGILLFLGVNRFAYLFAGCMLLLMLIVNVFQNYHGALTPMPESILALNYTINLVVIFGLVMYMTIFLIKTNHESEQKLTGMMETDSLTGLFNRRKYDRFTEDLCQQSCDKQFPVALMIFDIDYFKTFNDTYGHLAGDDALMEVADVLKKHVHRKTDLVARFGGEEFVVVLTRTEPKDAVALAHKIMRDVMALKIEHQYSLAAKFLTVSCGLIAKVPNEEDTFYDMFMAADQKLYQAKEQGRNQLAYDIDDDSTV